MAILRCIKEIKVNMKTELKVETTIYHPEECIFKDISLK